MWYLLLIPLAVVYVGYRLFPHKITALELLIPIFVGSLSILGSYFAVKNVTLQDVEYNGDLVTAVRYYEPYETWVTRTCTRTVRCGKNCHRTITYDCSYCNYTGPRWEAVTRTGVKQGISEIRYDMLRSKWGADPYFVELNRDINFRLSCGKDGDMYQANWDQDVLTSETMVWQVSFENPVKASHSAFKYDYISDEKADTLGLYRYPPIFDSYRQMAVLSKDFKFKDSVYRQFEFLNGDLGPSKRVKTFTLLFKDKDIHMASLQEQYWEGGNQNEIVVCIGVDSALNISWVKPFTWCDNKRVAVDLREDLSEIGVFDPAAISKVYERVINTEFKYKSFKDFNYLHFEPTFAQFSLVAFITLLTSVLSTLFIIKNEIDPI